MDLILKEFIAWFRAYIDNVVLALETLEEHITHLHTLLACLKNHSITLEPLKSIRRISFRLSSGAARYFLTFTSLATLQIFTFRPSTPLLSVNTSLPSLLLPTTSSFPQLHLRTSPFSLRSHPSSSSFLQLHLRTSPFPLRSHVSSLYLRTNSLLVDKTFDKLHKEGKISWATNHTPSAYPVFVAYRKKGPEKWWDVRSLIFAA
jgi:hypothetical protein